MRTFWGNKLIESLSVKMIIEFPNTKVSVRNIKNMKKSTIIKFELKSADGVCIICRKNELLYKCCK